MTDGFIDLCMDTEWIEDHLGGVLARMVCLDRKGHDGSCKHQRFTPFIRRTERSSDD